MTYPVILTHGADIHVAIDDERQQQEEHRQAGRFLHTAAGPISNAERLMILMEEIGEAAEAIMGQEELKENAAAFVHAVTMLGERARTTLNLRHLAHDAPHRVRGADELDKELVQCGAVVVAWLQGLRGQ